MILCPGVMIMKPFKLDKKKRRIQKETISW